MSGSARLEAELEQATARLRELDHRIKNDLQLIGSVLVLQLRRLGEGPERAAIRGALERVNAVAAVHRRLDVAGDPAHFEASALIHDLVEEILAAARRSDVAVRFALSPATVPSRQAAPLALITGELVHNALRHAFPDRPGEIEVRFGPEEGLLRLSVRDDGVGLPDGAPAPGGFGATLVGLLAQQLRGRYELVEAHPGVRAVVSFPQAA
ncbi:MAG: sensor histidine kinase [Alphaproteobacteria bacterium]|nr:sensor histidine kinase [Alphaproteobacteria bacterium]